MSLVAGPGRGGSGPDQLPDELQLVVETHVKYIQSLDTRKTELEYWLTEHLRINGIYWGLTALHLLGHPDALPRDGVLDFVISCLHDNGGFGAAPGHDAHMLYTVSAVQIITTLDAWEELERRIPAGREKIGRFIAGLQTQSGTFAGDEWGETDTRFLYGALNALSLMNLLHLVDLESAVAHVQTCTNLDGGYGTEPGAESHAGQIFTCVGALAIAGRMDLVDIDRLGGWLSERQLSNGGLNGRPEKLEDVCYSWWVISSMAMIGRLHWIDKTKLSEFILRCQDHEFGGISDRPGDMVDVFHTNFGIAGLSLLGYPGLIEIDPRYCMPREVTRRVMVEGGSARASTMTAAS
ncbi:Rab geranylgeranyltransferase [Zalaria obscura]|uniref:Rab geranylgeranyltransferase n=1 Tax=Zalaria obscura TaxID=2024903 RepID=A0ACC3SCK0_9PEZI